MQAEIRELTRACVHCGLCAPSCPTFRLLREELDSPRGRILLLDALAEGRIAPEDARPAIDRCIGCRACESACPSGVPFGALLEAGRARLGGPRPLARFVLRHVVTRPVLVGLLAATGRLFGRLPRGQPRLAWPEPPARPRKRVGFHYGCVTQSLFPRLAAESAHLLTRCGYEVEPAAGQTCCGALHRHAGLDATALEEKNARAAADYDFLASAAAGCSATDGFVDVMTLLMDAGPLRGCRLPPVRVAWDAPCHQVHAGGVDGRPALDWIEGVDVVVLPGAAECCGAGGLYMKLQPGLARAVRKKKLDEIAASGAEIVATPNPGCLLWIDRGLKERGLDVEVVHPVSLLARSLGLS